MELQKPYLIRVYTVNPARYAFGDAGNKVKLKVPLGNDQDSWIIELGIKEGKLVDCFEHKKYFAQNKLLFDKVFISEKFKPKSTDNWINTVYNVNEEQIGKSEKTTNPFLSYIDPEDEITFKFYEEAIEAAHRKKQKAPRDITEIFEKEFQLIEEAKEWMNSNLERYELLKKMIIYEGKSPEENIKTLLSPKSEFQGSTTITEQEKKHLRIILKDILQDETPVEEKNNQE